MCSAFEVMVADIDGRRAVRRQPAGRGPCSRTTPKDEFAFRGGRIHD